MSKTSTTSTKSSWLTVPQPRLGQVGLMILLGMVAMITPLSLDMYTPAIPHMAEHLSTTEGMVNLTLVGFFLFFGVGLLVFGPLADRRGRKPVLLGGLIAYSLGGLLCATAPTIEVLILARIVQALGAGASDSMANAIVKDAIVEERQQVAISFVQLMLVIGPVLAPIIGAWVVTAFSWRMTFWILAGAGAVCAALTCLFAETLPPERRVAGTSAGTVTQLKAVLSNRGFRTFLGVSSMFNMGFMAYVAVASYVYESIFGLSAMGYSTYFSAVALVTALGPFAWEFASRRTTARRFFGALTVAALASGVAMLAVGHAAPIAFCLCMLVFAVVEASLRPLSVNVLLNQAADDSGSASSIVNFTYTLVGCVGMLLVHAPFADYIYALAWIIVVSMAATLLWWAWMLRAGVEVKGI